MTAAPQRAPVVELRNVSKSFGGTQALSGVDLVVGRGEVHGLLGENGSGKSTLIKVLAGYHAPEAGATLEIGGRPVSFPLSPGAFRALGMSFVHQDLGLVGELSVLENLWIGELSASRTWRMPWRQLRARAREVFRRFGLELDPDSQVSELGSTDRALLAIVRAVEEMRASAAAEERASAELLVLDEPTVFLPRTGVDQLFAVIREIVARGASVLFVSHDLSEVREVTDRVTVLRNGQVAGAVATAEKSENELVELIIGRRLEVLEARRPAPSQEVLMSVTDLRGGLVNGVSFDCYAGEVLGLTGLVGSGFADTVYLLYGALRSRAGEFTLAGEVYELRRMTPHRAITVGIALLPANRQRDGSVASLTVADNVMLPVLVEYAAGGALRVRELDRACRELLTSFDVRPPKPDLDFDALSGGNQQKALLAKWLRMGPKMLLLHEPTQGVDVGARQQITATLREAARNGTGMICASADAEQVASLCDRVLILGRGRITAELTGDHVTTERITEQVLNSVTLQETAMWAAGT